MVRNLLRFLIMWATLAVAIVFLPDAPWWKVLMGSALLGVLWAVLDRTVERRFADASRTADPAVN
jgi:hypothetical protein